MSGAQDVKLPVYPSDNNDPLSSKGLLNERDEGLPTAVTNATSAKPAASMASAEGIKKIWPGPSLRPPFWHSRSGER